MNNKALFTHCHSHRLNLCIQNACTVQFVRNVMDQIKDISDFFNNSVPRQAVFRKNILECYPDTKTEKLRDVCRTRWVERVKGLCIFQEFFVPIVFSLEELSSTNLYNKETTSKASALLRLLHTFEFIVSLVVTRSVFDMTLPVTYLLQSSSLDVINGFHLIESVKSLFLTVRNSVQVYHDKWYTEAVALAREVNIEEGKRRTCKKQVHRDNHDVETVSEYFKQSLTLPIIDHLNLSLKDRFNSTSLICYKGFSIIPSVMMALKESPSSSWRVEFNEFFQFYKSDFPNPIAMEGECNVWEEYWDKYKGCCPDNTTATLKLIPSTVFKNITVALRILATLPVTSCECERSFSALRRLKDYARSTMVNERLNGLALMYVHKEIVPDSNKVIEKFSSGNRRLAFNL